jgi:MFS family permease
MTITMDKGPVASRQVRSGGGWYYGWNIVAICVLTQIAANGLVFYAMPLFLKPWSDELHAPISDILLAYLPMMMLTSLSSPFIGALADRKPAQSLLGIGLVGLVLIHLAVSVATKAWQIQALYAFALPLPACLASALVCNPVVSRWFIKRAGLALGLSAFGIAITGIVLPPLVAEVMPLIGWRNVWLAAALVIGLVILPITLLVMRDRPTEREGMHYLTTDGEVQVSHHGHNGSPLRWRDVLKRGNFWLLASLLIVVMNVYMGSLENMAPIALSRGFDQRTAGILLSILSFSHVASTLLMGVASDKFGNRVPLAFLSLTAASGAMLLGFGASLGTLVGGAAAVGLGGGIWPLLAAAIRAEFGAADMGSAFGMLMMTLMVPAVMPSMIARVQEVTGAYGSAMLALAVLALISGVCVLQLQENRRCVA